MKIIPAIDIIDGQCVRLRQGDYKQKTVYNDNPLTVALSFEKLGITDLHLVDLDGAREGKVVNWDVVEELCTHTSLKIDFGGGITTESDIIRLLELGISQVNVGSMAIRKASVVMEWLNFFGSEKIILAADVRDGYVATHGWSEVSTTTLSDLIDRFSGLEYVTCTDVSKDGMLSGANELIYRQLRERYPKMKIIASGGVRSMDDVHALDKLGLYGVIIGKAFYEGTIAPEQVQTYLRFQNPRSNGFSGINS